MTFSPGDVGPRRIQPKKRVSLRYGRIGGIWLGLEYLYASGPRTLMGGVCVDFDNGGSGSFGVLLQGIGFAAKFTRGMLMVADCRSFHLIEGAHVRALMEGENMHSVGHIHANIWFHPETGLRSYVGVMKDGVAVMVQP